MCGWGRITLRPCERDTFLNRRLRAQSAASKTVSRSGQDGIARHLVLVLVLVLVFVFVDFALRLRLGEAGS